MKSSEQLAELFTALSKAQGQIESASKNSLNPHFKSKYADLAAVIEVSQKPLFDNGLSLSQFPRLEGNGVVIESILGHSSGQWISNELLIPVAQQTAQAVGSAISYGRRYSRIAILGIASEDDDGNGANEKKPPTPEVYDELPHQKIELNEIFKKAGFKDREHQKLMSSFLRGVKMAELSEAFLQLVRTPPFKNDLGGNVEAERKQQGNSPANPAGQNVGEPSGKEVQS